MVEVERGHELAAGRETSRVRAADAVAGSPGQVSGERRVAIWSSVVLMVLGLTVGGLGLIFHSWWLILVGVGISAAGGIWALTARIMDATH